MDFDKSETKKNLETALKGEALAHLKYNFYKKQLSNFNKKYENILDIIIQNEKEHGKIWFKQLNHGEIPENNINLLDAIENETYEASVLYLEFAETANKEGFNDISRLFYNISQVEADHANQFRQIRHEINQPCYYKKKEPVWWKCLNCGHLIFNREAPDVCPVCNHPQKYFIHNKE